MRRVMGMAAAVVALAGCGTSTLSVSSPSESEQMAAVEHKLSARLEQEFGKGARVQAVIPAGGELLVGVATEALPQDGDEIPTMGFARYDEKADALTVVARETSFTDARTWGTDTALVSDEGALILRGDGDVERTVATGVLGELHAAPDGASAAVTLTGESVEDAETKVALVRKDGTLTVIADGAGSDTRPMISPDGKTVVFVSGRTGVASFFRTTVEGGEPVQLTNVALEAGAPNEDESDPAGFVPPPASAARSEFVDADTLRFDAGDGELWTLNIRTGAAARVGGAK